MMVEAAGIERASDAPKSLTESDGVLSSRRLGLAPIRVIGKGSEKTCTNLYQGTSAMDENSFAQYRSGTHRETTVSLVQDNNPTPEAREQSEKNR
jgi:hypothetical protein